MTPWTIPPCRPRRAPQESPCACPERIRAVPTRGPVQRASPRSRSLKAMAKPPDQWLNLFVAASQVKDHYEDRPIGGSLFPGIVAEVCDIKWKAQAQHGRF